MMFGVKEIDEKRAVQALYDEFYSSYRLIWKKQF